MKVLLALAASLPMLSSASTAVAGTFSGNWPLTVTHAMFIDGKYCLTLAGGGRSGTATIPGMQEGGWEIINRKLMVVMPVPLQGQNGALTFETSAANGKLSSGAAVQIEGGGIFDSGSLAAGSKGGC